MPAAAEASPGVFVRLTMTDSGCGIEPEALPHIFEPFFTTKGTDVGTGLGLATVYGVVKQHRGWVTVTSAPGDGASFDVYLPAVEAHLTEVAAAGRPFTMRLSGTDTFRPLSPVVFVRVVEGAEACMWLQQRVRDPEGPVARELQFPYHPHVTVAHGIDEAAMDRAQDLGPGSA